MNLNSRIKVNTYYIKTFLVAFIILFVVVHGIYVYRVQIYYDEHVQNVSEIETVEVDMMSVMLDNQMRTWAHLTDILASSRIMNNYLLDPSDTNEQWAVKVLTAFVEKSEDKYQIQVIDAENTVVIDMNNFQVDRKVVFTENTKSLLDKEELSANSQLKLYPINVDTDFESRVCTVTPISDDDQNIIGYGILNFSGENIIKSLLINKNNPDKVRALADPKGSYITSRGRVLHLGTDGQSNVNMIFSEETTYINGKVEGQFFSDKGLVTFKRFKPLEACLHNEQTSDADFDSDDDMWMTVSFVPEADFVSYKKDIWASMLKIDYFLVPFMTLVALAIAHYANMSKEYKEKIEAFAMQDPLTGLFNRRAGLEFFDHQIQISKRYGESFTIGFIDVNELKPVNDNYGHHEGDFLIRKVCDTIESHKRTSDILSRFGGDEFILILPMCKQGEAEEVLSRVEMDLNLFNDSGNKPYTISMSYGFYEYKPEDDHTREDMIFIAEQKMYEFKRAYKERNNK